MLYIVLGQKDLPCKAAWLEHERRTVVICCCNHLQLTLIALEQMVVPLLGSPALCVRPHGGTACTQQPD